MGNAVCRQDGSSYTCGEREHNVLLQSLCYSPETSVAQDVYYTSIKHFLKNYSGCTTEAMEPIDLIVSVPGKRDTFQVFLKKTFQLLLTMQRVLPSATSHFSAPTMV